MKKIFALSLLVCLTITLVFTTALAQEEQNPVYVSPIDGTYFEVSAGDEIVLWNGWVACTRGLATAFLTSFQSSWELDGESLFSSEEEVAEFWFPLQPHQPYSECIPEVGRRQTWFAGWWYPIGSFDDVGNTHTVTLNFWFDHPVTDGFDLDGDGRPDKYSGSESLSATIKVVP
jgi:hypothetical protein